MHGLVSRAGSSGKTPWIAFAEGGSTRIDAYAAARSLSLSFLISNRTSQPTGSLRNTFRSGREFDEAVSRSGPAQPRHRHRSWKALQRYLRAMPGRWKYFLHFISSFLGCNFRIFRKNIYVAMR